MFKFMGCMCLQENKLWNCLLDCRKEASRVTFNLSYNQKQHVLNPFTVPNICYHQARSFELAYDSRTNRIPNYMLIDIINKLLICIA